MNKYINVGFINSIIGCALEKVKDEVSPAYYRGAKDVLDHINKMAEHETEPFVKDINIHSKTEPQTEMPKCSINGTPYDECGFCEYFNCDTCICEADVPRTERR